MASTLSGNTLTTTDLVVDGTTLVTDSTNNRVGIGTTSPAYALDIESAVSNYVRVTRTGTTQLFMGCTNGATELYSRNATTGAVPMTFNVGTSEAMRIDSSGNVGIGTSSPSATLQVEGDLRLAHNNPIEWGGTAYSIVGNATTGYLQFNTASTERMRIDSSGNLLVGKQSTASGVAGHEIFGSGVQWMTAAGRPLLLNRLSTDGSIIELRKDGTTVGSIGSVAGISTYIDGGSTFSGIQFGDELLPRKSGAIANGTVNLGSSSARYKDLYLSGGVYVGGTTSANYLDDYEEGTFTPTIQGSTTAGSGSYTLQVGRYIKVGSQVTVTVRINWSGHTGTGSLYVSGLPFTSVNIASYTPVGSVLFQNVVFSGAPSDGLCSYVPADRTRIEFYESVSAAAAAAIPMDAAGEAILTITYQSA